MTTIVSDSTRSMSSSRLAPTATVVGSSLKSTMTTNASDSTISMTTGRLEPSATIVASGQDWLGASRLQSIASGTKHSMSASNTSRVQSTSPAKAAHLVGFGRPLDQGDGAMLSLPNGQSLDGVAQVETSTGALGEGQSTGSSSSGETTMTAVTRAGDESDEDKSDIPETVGSKDMENIEAQEDCREEERPGQSKRTTGQAKCRGSAADAASGSSVHGGVAASGNIEFGGSGASASRPVWQQTKPVVEAVPLVSGGSTVGMSVAGVVAAEMVLLMVRMVMMQGPGGA
ncbi:hypothetical protein CDD82_6125 [Ophiocordyceps australis]|uniref:Uncharacterized protein n=1 Tax=Ophiocordyceps australis TaxID=1399860 RepID=A0A2C5XH50_9HYPO|nr:hypothetical protein CDD82_6125 [Ophiocordyceps australis]